MYIHTPFGTLTLGKCAKVAADVSELVASVSKSSSFAKAVSKSAFKKFSKVSTLSKLLCERTVELTSEESKINELNNVVLNK